MGVLGYEPLEEQIEPEGGGARGDVAVVYEVAPGGVGERAGLCAGDVLVAINGAPVRDGIDLLFQASEPKLKFEIERGGERKTLRATREFGEELGVALKDFRIKLCNNQCVFCFIHQNPKGLRRGIYVKDGDFRMSFLHGNYITTTNMKDEDFERTIEQGLSPMYVSVHTTNHELRLKMLGVKRSTPIMETLGRLAAGGIDFHTQIVLCPGLNDGAELERTIADLATFDPGLLSIAIVPLGMTEHREGLPELEPVTPSFCKRTIEQMRPWQRRLEKQFGEPVLFLADEFYVTADEATPDYSDCDVLHQLENGVGMVWEFGEAWGEVEAELPGAIERERKVAVLTGLLGARVLKPYAERLSRVEGLCVDVVPVMNELFGRSITVSGLLGGRDFLRAMRENPGYDRYLIPGNAVRAEGEMFLDDMKLEELVEASGGRVRALEGDCEDLAQAALGKAEVACA